MLSFQTSIFRLTELFVFSCKGSTFPTLEILVNALKYGDVDGILVDLYTANYRSDLFNATWIVVSQIISFEFTSGVVISGNAAKLEQHFRNYVGNKSTVVTDILQKTNEANDRVREARAFCAYVFSIKTENSWDIHPCRLEQILSDSRFVKNVSVPPPSSLHMSVLLLLHLLLHLFLLLPSSSPPIYYLRSFSFSPPSTSVTASAPPPTPSPALFFQNVTFLPSCSSLPLLLRPPSLPRPPPHLFILLYLFLLVLLLHLLALHLFHHFTFLS